MNELDTRIQNLEQLLETHDLSFSIKHKRGVRKTALYVREDGRLELISPVYVPKDALAEQIKMQRGYIDKMRAHWLDVARQEKLRYDCPAIFSVAGKKYNMEYSIDPTCKRARAERHETKITLFAPTADKVRELLLRLEKELLLQEIEHIAAPIAAELAVEVKQWQIRFMKTRWGSCTKAKGRISINQALAALPRKYLELTVAHELCHMAYANHSKNFWQLLSVFVPNHQELQIELNKLS